MIIDKKATAKIENAVFELAGIDPTPTPKELQDAFVGDDSYWYQVSFGKTNGTPPYAGNLYAGIIGYRAWKDKQGDLLPSGNGHINKKPADSFYQFDESGGF